jgi:DNA-binding MarR family transcriptional regulator
MLAPFVTPIITGAAPPDPPRILGGPAPVHVPARLRIVVTLAALPDGDALSFTRLQDMIGLTPGNLITHLRKLEDAGYITSEKIGNGVASRTSVALTDQGRAALRAYTETLRGILAGL